ncbi:MAG: hypothetical protein EOP88_04645 [Verrucomicrobiaceae bacterium]|nr:MAG: hypothetical protein EOP88_04645 [Verrucomicrobiaceae bacterium]
MKTTTLLTAVVLASTAAFASAQDEKPKREPRQIPAEVLKKYDKDGDGKLSEDERKALQSDRKAEQEKILKKYDKDGDGKLSEEERKALRADAEAKHKALLEKYDADKDGKLSESERKTAVDAGEEIPFFRGGRGGRGGPGGGGRGEGKGADAAPAGE